LIEVLNLERSAFEALQTQETVLTGLFIEKSIDIDAFASSVWKVLTDPGLTRLWIPEWRPGLEILDSDWKRGGSALWRTAGGLIGAAGTVTSVEPDRMLSFSFRGHDADSSQQETVTFTLNEQGSRTKLSVSVGDFRDDPEHEKDYPNALTSWERALPKIKELAEKETRVQAPPKQSLITLREITRETLSRILELKVSAEQERFVAPNAVSISQAHLHSEHAWFRGIYADDTPVGFVMLYDDSKAHEYYLWRFMIDHRYQRRGFGFRAMELVTEHVRRRPGATKLLLSCVPGDGSPGPFYEKLGFAYTGEIDQGELVMGKDL
jgi:diamine N-acetyltransferase